MIRLEVEQGEAKGRVFEQDAEEITLGRAPNSDLLLPDWHVSGSHGVITVESASGAVRYRDLKSTNGSRVIRGKQTLPVDSTVGFELALKHGDRLQLGDHERPVLVGVSIAVLPATTPFLPTTGSMLTATIPPRADGSSVLRAATVQAVEEPEAKVLVMRPVETVAEVQRTVESDPGSLKGLLSVLRKLTGAIELDEVFDAIEAAVFEAVPKATHLTLALRDDSGDKPTYVAVTTRVRGRTDKSGEAVPISKSVVRKVVEQRAAVLAADAMREVGETASIMGAKILSTMGVPLWRGEEILGVLQVDNRAQPGMFKDRDLDLLMLVGQQASLAVHNARLYRQVKQAEMSARTENSFLKQRAQKKFEGIIGDSKAMQSLFEKMAKVVDTRVSVLIEGETGTGKELVASAVHYQSRRKDRLFIAQNCAALPETLLESELFGHKKGAFTGATEDKKGLFELADGGTLFLDEIGEMPLGLQAKILRTLQEGEVRPLGSGVVKNVDVRIVAATNRKLEDEVAAGRFRQDLYYRLQVFPVRIPALRERREDIPVLAAHFLKRYTHELGKPVAGFSQQAMELLMSYDFPGNVRELENEVQRLVIQCEPGGYVMAEHLSPRIRNIEGLLDKIRAPRGTLKDMIEHIEKWLLIEALREHGNNKSATAKTLGITREGLHKKLKGYGIS
ncbi:MAG: sigma 54-interacting transcriptional regulator [Deltaproteobacteria bacterium]|nr:sigma 54-interacting transcriptional regulator [Myxococcales bacterium]MDP3219552.1 sigma 54-interacting transcriptional regulator [Deltaproteobacteria bacterium]